VNYPDLEQEIAIINGHHQRKGVLPVQEVKPILTAAQVTAYRNAVQHVHIESNLVRYIAQIVNETRNNNALYLGASPRASVAVLNSAKAYAAVHGRDFVTPEDIKTVAVPALRHRVMLTPDKEMEGLTTDEVVKQIIDKIEVPR
jgi:MoxR-like ATPase